MLFHPFIGCFNIADTIADKGHSQRQLSECAICDVKENLQARSCERGEDIIFTVSTPPPTISSPLICHDFRCSLKQWVPVKEGCVHWDTDGHSIVSER